MCIYDVVCDAQTQPGAPDAFLVVKNGCRILSFIKISKHESIGPYLLSYMYLILNQLFIFDELKLYKIMESLATNF